MTDEPDDVVAKIDEAISDYEKHLIHVPEDLMPDLPELAPLRSYAEEISMLDLGKLPLTFEADFPWQNRLIEAAMRGEKFQILPLGKSGRPYVAGRVPDDIVEAHTLGGETFRYGIYDEAVDFRGWDGGNPLFDKSDAWLDDLSPDLSPEETDTLFETKWCGRCGEEYDPTRESHDGHTISVEDRARLAATPAPEAPRPLGRTLRACASFVWSRIPGTRS